MKAFALSLAEELPRQQARCRKLLEDVLTIGPSGIFLASMLRADLARAEKAAAAGDLAAMISACQVLEGYES